MAGAALLISDNSDITDKVSTVFEFINYDVVLTNSIESTKTEINNDERFLIALILLSDETVQTEVIALLTKCVPALPVYLLNKNHLTDKENNISPKGLIRSMPYPVQYKNLLGSIRRAEQGRTGSRSGRGFSTSLTGTSPQIKEIEALVRHVSTTDANVLLLGESGTGKEVVARGIHHLSLRGERPFIAVNCGAIPPELLESELFGHEKGAFTGAISMRRGRFELAEGGTLFLDEIGDMPMSMQVKLLRVLQERTFERVGGTKTISSNVRLIAATHQDLENRIDEGKFRMDLFYRLNVFPIDLAPIRDRVEDIPLLIKEFSTRMELAHQSPIEFDASAIEALSNHPLPGNVRELENLVERLAILFPGETITNEKLPRRYQIEQGSLATKNTTTQNNELSLPNVGPSDEIDLKQYLSAMERTLIQQALTNSNWVVAKAAKSLSLQRTTLVEKIRKLEIQQPV